MLVLARLESSIINMRLYHSVRGFSLIEVVAAAGIFLLLVTGFVSALSLTRRSALNAGNRGRALFLAEEGLEAVRNIRDERFANLADGDYGLAALNGVYGFTPAADVTGIFTRAVVITSVDATTKEIASTVTWPKNFGRPGQVSLTTYLISPSLPSTETSATPPVAPAPAL